LLFDCLSFFFIFILYNLYLSFFSYYSPSTGQATTNAPLTSTTSARPTSGNDGMPLNRSAPDRKTIHTIPTRQHHATTNTSATTSGIHPDHRASTRNPPSHSMAYNDTNNRFQQGAIMSNSNNGAQSFLSKLSSKFARR